MFLHILGKCGKLRPPVPDNPAVPRGDVVGIDLSFVHDVQGYGGYRFVVVGSFVAKGGLTDKF
jgi:hypothetical protein